MKKILLAATILLLPSIASADDFVNGYNRRDGSYVQPHYKTEKDESRFNNYSTQGNTNPYTQQKGYQDPYSNNHNNNFGGYGSNNHRR